MKKSVLSLLTVVLLSVQFGFAQNSNVTDFLNEISTDKYSSVFMKQNITENMEMDQIGTFEEMEIYTINEESEVDESIVKELIEKIYTLKADAKYTSLMQVKDDGDHVDMYVKKEGDLIKELTMFIVDSEGEVVIIRMKGDFSEDVLDELMNGINV